MSDEFMNRDGEDFEPRVPKPRKRDRPVPRAADPADMDRSMRRIVDDILARDGVELRWRGRGRKP